MTTNTRSSVDFLPKYLQTEKNSKFLSSTIDQLMSVPQVKRIDSFVGSKDTPNYSSDDRYITETNTYRQAYQLEPALVLKTLTQEIKKAYTLDDLLNQIDNNGGNSKNLDRIFEPKFYSYNPNIDWDKFINFREYYWLPTGPSAISISGVGKPLTVEYTVTDAEDGVQFLFNNLVTSQQLILYRGTTYVFNVNSVHNFYIKYANTVGPNDQFNINIINNGVKNGQIILTVSDTTPDILFYTSSDDQLATGSIFVKNSDLNTTINVEDDIIGKKSYTSSTGIKFINGLKVTFVGTVFPEKYRDAEFIVDGVGKAITLIRFTDLATPDVETELFNTRFDGTNFDEFPFDNFSNIPIIPEYVTISKASKDLNPWTRYNRWFHSDVIREVAKANNVFPEFPSNYRASRPIVEFLPNIELYNFGTKPLPNIDLIDNVTENAFLKVANQEGIYIDGVYAESGYRIIFAKDKDPLVRDKIFRINLIKINGKTKIELVKEDDFVVEKSSVVVKSGVQNKGSSYWFNGSTWIKAQQKLSRNQSPLFDLFDDIGNSYSDTSVYATNFTGNKIFGYAIGTGITDKVLGFPLQYKNVGVEGTYLFNNYFSTEKFLVVKDTVTTYQETAGTYFRIDGKLQNVWIEGESYEIPIKDGVYEVPLNLTNNPLNDPISSFTLTELSEHVGSMVKRDTEFEGVFPGLGNIKDLPNISKYGTKLISNINPLSFAHHFISDNENSIVSAIRTVGEHYYQFKLNLIKTLSTINQTLSPAEALDVALRDLNKNKTSTFPYYYSDMVPYGAGAVVREFTVTNSKNKNYSFLGTYSDKKLSTTGVLVYLNGKQLILGKNYQLSKEFENNVEILDSLTRGDKIEVKYYPNTSGSFIPPTPTKLGLYPKFEPTIYSDDTFAFGPKNVLQGHDGSLTILFDDYRDAILLELESRIFNNIKVDYRQDLLDINSVLPGISRKQQFTYEEIFNPIVKDFSKWKTSFAVETTKNSTFDITFPKTFNYKDVVVNGTSLPGNWRAIFKMYFDTDRPHTHPWEMLGFSMKPTWWDEEYGPAPYASGNSILWNDLRDGRIKYGPREGVDPLYIRPNLYDYLPVDQNGNMVDVRYWGPLGKAQYLETASDPWKFGDSGPAENSWRRSSYWPFAIQIILALTKPATYSALMYDTSRIVYNAIGQTVYSEDNLFINHSKVLIPFTTNNGSIILTAGFSVFLVEAGMFKNSGYITLLQESLANSTFNLMYKFGGFVSKDKLEIGIDSVNPNSINPGILLPSEDYTIHFNVSNPVKIINISGVIVQKLQNKYIVRGYDRVNSYFNVYQPIHQKNDEYISIGGQQEEYSVWSTNVFYSIGEIIYYNNSFYRSTNNHNSGTSFDSKNYSLLSELPITNATVIAYSTVFENTITEVPYGTVYESYQEVVDLLAGYGMWLETQGFVFDEFNTDLNDVLDWKFTAKEFTFWATQGWADNSVITLSPFANTIKFQFKDSVIDNIFDSFYDYSLLKADGNSFPRVDLSISRTDGQCSISSKNDQEGIFFASLRLVQKEHSLILNNISRFNDVIYDISTGYRQRRIKLIGLITANWNGDYFSPGFIYDSAIIKNWKPYQDYYAGDVVEYAGSYYSLDRNLTGTEKFNFTNWNKLGKKPVAQLIPNFEYKIDQFQDFYSLEIDNFDIGQQELAQHLTGYSSRVYLNNIFFDQIAQYKFFQGFIKEKGTRNALDKLSRASVHNLQGKLEFNEEWAFRIGYFGAYASLEEIEFPLDESKIIENEQLVKFVEEAPVLEYDSNLYITENDLSIKPLDYTTTSTFYTKFISYDINPFALPVAGYVKKEDVDYTLKTKDDLLNFALTNTVNQGDIFWIGYDDNKDWGVYRYTRLPAIVTEVFENIAGESIGFKTNVYHGLSVGDIIAVTRLSDDINGCYVISEINKLNEFIVRSTKTVPLFNTGSGVLFKFVSSRFEKFDDLVGTKFVADIFPGRKIWVDANENGQWEVYEKIDNYNPYFESNKIVSEGAFFSESIASKESTNLVLVSAPRYTDSNGTGLVYIYRRNEAKLKFINLYPLNLSLDQYYENTNGRPEAKFGFALDIDSVNEIMVASAPFASNVKTSGGSTNYVTVTNLNSGYNNLGIVVLSTMNSSGNAEFRHKMITCQEPSNDVYFGHSLAISSNEGIKTLLVGAPGKNNNQGAVYTYDVAYYQSFDSLTTEVNVTATSQIKLPTDSISLATGSRFGDGLATNLTATRVAVSAPGHDNSRGAVFVFDNTGTGYYYVQSLAWNDAGLGNKISSDGQFGFDLDMDDSGNYLFVSAYNAYDPVLQRGKVVVYEWTGTQYTISQVIDNPSPNPGLKFGASIESDSSGNVLAITSQGPNYFAGASFDAGTTTFDAEATRIGATIDDSGSAYIYNRYQNKFIYASELYTSNITQGSAYGYSISVNRNSVYVGAPKYINTSTIHNGSIIYWEAKDPNSNSWNLLRQQDPLVDVDKIKQVKTINLFDEQVQDYLEIFDPVKGKIPTLADKEIRYKVAFDPAVYNFGEENFTNKDSQTRWGDAQVGELWWDLSNVKYVWYEQGDNESRKNNWGQLFPGCTIDVYEWVKSDYPPSIWLSSADTIAGLQANISGVPKYPKDTAYVIEEIYSPNIDAFIGVYYFWVKNTVIVPNRQGRTLSAYDVALLIENPKLFGLKYIQPLSKNALSLVNIKGSLINKRIALNIQLDDIDSNINKHTEWLLLEEGNANNIPTPTLEKKFIDSLLGKDSLGNIVPDPTLKDRQKYGISIRPRQSMFKNRLSALRNFIEYANTIFAENLITDYSNLEKMKSAEPIPDSALGEYDIIVADLIQLNAIDLNKIKRGRVSCSIYEGRISGLKILDAGYGYGALDALYYDENQNPIKWKGPTITISNNFSNAQINLVVDSYGKIVDALVVDPGEGFTTTPELFVRPYTAIVRSDSSSRGLWTKYALTEQKTWEKLQTQSYDTNLCWSYVDWVSPAFNQYKNISEVCNLVSEIYNFDLLPGDYIKVLDNGLGRYLILRKTDGVNGTFDNNFDILYNEKGTIKITDSLWKTFSSQLGWDQISPYDNTLWDQNATTELKNIITAMRDDIFIGNLKVYWNKIFFASVKYALTEQKSLDWAFKTSFINVYNKAGELTQRPVYKFQDAQWYEDYLNEIKPYHSTVRSYQLTYDVTEPTVTYTTDFDLPVAPDINSGKTVILGETDTITSSVYPYKGWYDNRTLYVESIQINIPGTGYIANPLVKIIAAPGDKITREATAEAVISSGKIINFVITDPGEGYTSTPTVVITGGGLTSADTPAKASVRLANRKVRSNKIGLKFDRISDRVLINDKNTVDTFTGDGVTFQYVLSWPCFPDKGTIFLRVNGVPVATSAYEIENFISTDYGYSQVFTKLVLDSVPKVGAIIKISYIKDISIYTAYDRINEYYKEISNYNPGANKDEKYAQLMTGMEYPGTEIKTEPLYNTGGWDVGAYGTTKWDKQSFDVDDLDTFINGGTLETTGTGTNIKFTSASGVNPSDIILDGDTFISPTRSYAPEEMIPGELKESLAINVFDRTASGSATIYNHTVQIAAYQPTVIDMKIIPPSEGSVSVSFNKKLLVKSYDYVIDYSEKKIRVTPRSEDGQLSIVYMDVGGTGFISMNSNVTEGSIKGSVLGDCQYSQVKSVYVTVNGLRIEPQDLTSIPPQTLYYIFGESDPGSDKRAKVTVYGLGTVGKNTITAAFFTSRNKGYSEVYEQEGFGVTDNNNRLIPLIQPPGKLGPYTANSIVEMNGKRLSPPNTTYYEITSTSQTTFNISSKEIYEPKSFDKTRIEVYINGKIVAPREFYLDDDNNQIIFNDGTFSIGDVLAITALKDYDYVIRNGILQFSETYRIPQTSGSNYIRIITFTNHDPSLIRTEVFKVNSNRLYKISRNILNDNLVWVSVGDKSLVAGTDFRILENGNIVQITDSIPFAEEDDVIITSFGQTSAAKTVAWKQFVDMVGRHHYKRLDKSNTTFLTVPLQLTDTEIHVENGDILPIPDIKHNTPGIIFIAGERIEYLEKNGNVLSNLRRATMGTGAKEFSTAGTWVIDQGKQQTVPYKDRYTVYTTVTSVASTGFSIELDPNLFTFVNGVRLSDQIDVYCGGKLLIKPPQPGNYLFVHDASTQYNPINITAKPADFSVSGSVTTATLVIDIDLQQNVEIKVVQHKGETWYSNPNTPWLEQSSPQAVFINSKEAISPDQLYYGGDPILRFDDGTPLLLDDGREIKGY